MLFLEADEGQKELRVLPKFWAKEGRLREFANGRGKGFKTLPKSSRSHICMRA